MSTSDQRLICRLLRVTLLAVLGAVDVKLEKYKYVCRDFRQNHEKQINRSGVFDR